MAISRSWQNLKDFLRKTYNREVNEWFRDEPDPIPDNSTSRKQAKRACLITSRDSQNMALLKSLTFRYVVQRVHLVPDVFGTPVGNFDATRKHKPQVFLEFLEDELDIEGGYARTELIMSPKVIYRVRSNLDVRSITIAGKAIYVNTPLVYL